MDHYKPHKIALFEGYYTRIQLKSGSSLISIICTCPYARSQAYMTNLTYVSASGEIWQQQCFPSELGFKALEDGSKNGFRFMGKTINTRNAVEGQTLNEEYLLHASPSSTRLVHKNATAQLIADIKPPTLWSNSTAYASPESWLSLLPLPLHWHVYNLSSPCTIQLSLPDDAPLDPRDKGPNVVGIAHQEKNWALSFPSAHIWMQAREGDDLDDNGIKQGKGRGIALAGGRIMGMDAFLVGYRNEEKRIELDFRPPWALKVFGLIGPTMQFTVDWENRTFSIDVRGLLWKLKVKAHGPKEGFYPLASPYATGHKENWLAQTLQADVNVEVWRKGGMSAGDGGWLGAARECLLGEWELVCKDSFERGALEFGGDYYPLRGTDRKGK